MVRYIEEDEEKLLTLQDLPPSAYLVLLIEGRNSHTFPLRGEIYLGREKNNGIVVADRKVSRRHVALKPIDDTFIVIDQGSANGTYVNGMLIGQPTRLRHQDKIRIGDATFLFTTNQPDSSDDKVAASSASAPAISATPEPAASLSPAPSQSPAAHAPTPLLADSNRPVWMIIGCMALAIVVLLILLALLFGLFLGGSGQLGLLL